MNNPRLENWRIQTFSDGEQCLWGEVYDDVRYLLYNNGEFTDGHVIRTSIIKMMDIDEKWAETMNTKYILGVKLT